MPYPRENVVIIAFQVEDIDEAFAELSERGVVFPKGIGEEEWGRCVHFKNTEGNRLQLYEPRPGY